jgi:hypothetical protein
MMQATYHRLRNDPASLWRFHRTRLRSMVIQPRVRRRLVIISAVRGQQAMQVLLAHNDDVVEHLAAD